MLFDCKRFAAVAMAASLVACGGDDAAGGEGGAGGGSGGSPNAPPPNAVGGFSIELPEFTIEPGEELEPCWVVPLELVGDSRWVAAAMMHTEPGLHHGNLTSRPIKDPSATGVRKCSAEDAGGIAGGEATDVLAGGQVLFGSTTQVVGEEWRTFPEGMAYEVPEGHEIVARMHYLNTTSEPQTLSPSYEWYTVPEADVTQPIAPYIWVNDSFEIPPLQEHTVDMSCWLPPGMKVVEAMPHMHQLGVRMAAGYLGGERDGEMWLESSGYAPDEGLINTYDPAVDLGQGDGMRWTCEWRNTFNKPIVHGIGDNEMCMMFGYAYPPEHSYTVYATGEDSCFYISPPTD